MNVATTSQGREIRGLAILALANQIKRLDASTYKVKSQSGNGWYNVLKENTVWKCECPDFRFRNMDCKHIHAVKFSLNLRERVTSQNLGLESLYRKPEVCISCSSQDIVKDGLRCNKKGKIQRYVCKSCGLRFVQDYGFQKMKNNPKVITLVMDLYFKGVSLRKIVDHLKQFYSLKVSHVAIIKWIRKYTRLMKEYVKDLTPQTSGIWHTDEMTININGEYNWLWNLMDSDTRFLLASQLSKKREILDARKVFAEAKETAKARPAFVITDGLHAYRDAFTKEFYTNTKPRPEHIRLPSIRERPNNNLIERFHGTVRERDKVMRALDNDESAPNIIDGFRVYYNFIRPHMSLNGKTPAQVAGIDLELEQNRWLSLIQKSVISRKLPPKNFSPSSP